MVEDLITLLEYLKGCLIKKDLSSFYLVLRVKLGRCMEDTMRQRINIKNILNVTCSKRESAVS